MPKFEYVTCPKCGSYQIEQRPRDNDALGNNVVCVDCENVLEMDEQPDDYMTAAVPTA